MKITGKRIVFILYDYPLAVSTMIINTIAMLKENKNEVVVITDENQQSLRCEDWLEDLIIPITKSESLVRLLLFKNIYNFFYLITKKTVYRFIPGLWKKIKGYAGEPGWEKKNKRLINFSIELQQYLNDHECDIIMAVECFSLIAVDTAMVHNASPTVFYFDMELLDWSPENPLYDDKLELKQRQYAALKRVNHVIITSFNRAKIFAEINNYPEDKISVLPVVPRSRNINIRSNYFRNKFNIPEDKILVIYTGNFRPWAQCVEIIESMGAWPSDSVLVMHTWNKAALLDDYFEQMLKSVRNYPVYFSDDYLSYEELGYVLSSADIGLLYYEEIDENFTEICFSSNKMGEYLASGLPVICSPFPSLKEFVESNKIGFAVNFDDIGSSIKHIAGNKDYFSANVRKCCDEFFIFDKYFEKVFADDSGIEI